MLIDLHDPISKTSKTYQVHRLVAKAYIPNDDLTRDYVNHKNGDKTDNDVSNLEWVTHKENVEHAWKTGLCKPRYGTDNPANKYSYSQIKHVCELLEQGLTLGNIAFFTGVTPTTVYDIKKRHKWEQISSMYIIRESDIDYWKYTPKIFDLIDKNKTSEEICCQLDIPDIFVDRIKFIKDHRYAFNDYRN